MSNKITILNCPNCGAGLPNVHEHIVKCSYCGSNVLLEFNEVKKVFEVERHNQYGRTDTSAYTHFPILKY